MSNRSHPISLQTLKPLDENREEELDEIYERMVARKMVAPEPKETPVKKVPRY